MEELNWIKLNWIRNSEIAKRLGISVGLFSQKLNNESGNKFVTKNRAGINEVEKLREIRKALITELLE